MATTVSRPAPAGPGPNVPRDPRIGRERPLGGFELWMWLFMRISGLVLLVLAIGHTLIMHLPAGGVSRVNFGFVAVRWENPIWRAWDWMLLVLALIHGVNGLRNITLDYVRSAAWRFGINMLFYTLGFGAFVLGTVVVFTFQPPPGM
ncbi:MAG: succinate dehydrogenase hydrophobic membrane anchor subunit [Actinomycetota bacterium]